MASYLFCFIAAFVAVASVKGLHLEPPLEEIVITSGAQFTIECYHDEPIYWKFFDRTIDIEYSKDEKTSLFVSRLSLHDKNYLDTGYYACSPINKEESALRVYIFIWDSINLLAVNDSFAYLTGNQYSSLVIPCRPTHPDVNVTLSHNSEQVTDVLYDRYIGFTKTNLQLTDSGMVVCTAAWGDRKQDIYYEISVHSRTDGVPKPSIYSESPVLLGQNATLECIVRVPLSVLINVEWKVPSSAQFLDERITENSSVSKIKVSGIGMKEGKQILHIRNVKETDAGTYKCIVTDHSNHTNQDEYSLEVIPAHVTHLNLSLEGSSEIVVRVGETKAQWIVDISANPSPHLSWYDPNGREISIDNGKFNIDNARDRTKVTIKDLGILDSGVYQLKAENDLFQKTLNISLLIEDKPSVKLNSQDFYILHQEYNLRCAIIAYPVPVVTWYYRNCYRYPDCSNQTIELDSNEYVEFPDGVRMEHSLKVIAKNTGQITCQACNFIGCENETISFLVTDIPDGLDFNVWTSHPMVVSSDNITLSCGASVYNYNGELEWLYSDSNTTPTSLLNDTDISIINNWSKYSYQSNLHLNNISLKSSGTYFCRARSILNLGILKEKQLTIDVKAQQKPEIVNTNMNSSYWELKMGDKITLTCGATGVPQPTIYWYKNGRLLHLKNDTRIRMIDNNQSLMLSYVVLDDDGQYICQVLNRAGISTLRSYIRIKPVSTKANFEWIIFPGIFLVITFIIGFSILACRIKRMKKLRSELYAAGLYNFAEGQIESLNFELDIHEQADLLPYDKKWEFPREKLKLGKQLGSGAFGVVMKAEAYDLKENGEATTVAVKMVKKNSDFALIKALASELKIMAHLGQHLNVVNLLGACTGNINNRELLVLVEYCRYGNLHNYLLRHRDAFINQVSAETGTIEALSRNKMIELSYFGEDPANSAKSNTGQISDYSNSVNTDMTSLSTPVGDDGYLVSKEPEWRTYYQGDYKSSNIKPICTQDLLCWSYQVAKGMEYLATRKVLHGDLAARNILLADDNIVKICDFGLAKSMYSSGNYCKKGNDPLPVKWMAIEALRDRVFSTQSDIWAFGIVLWEMFSLAKTPYPGIQFGPEFFNKLLEGYRMEKPDFSTTHVYDLMKECWSKEPMDRPSFTECAERLGNALEDSVKQHYMDLNSVYLQLNSQEPDKCDYLSMLTPPTFANYCSPSSCDTPPVDGYLNMQRASTEVCDEMELKPMLPTPAGNSYVTPTGLKSFFNPGYEGLNRLKENTYMNVSQQPTIHV